MSDITDAQIQGVKIINLTGHDDSRGVFVETYRKEWLPEAREMIQGNRADRQKGSLVGLHFHPTQADYWYISQGTAQIMLHDLRSGSPTEGKTVSIEAGLAPDGSFRHMGIYIPPGVGHGFAAITDITLHYLVDSYYDTAEELGVIWNDPDIAAPWQVTEPVLSDRDKLHPKRGELGESLPKFPAA
jgi:dTDP-4-dehydrorhamnose 3,5-epimerase